MDQATIKKIKDFYSPEWYEGHITFNQFRHIHPGVLTTNYLTFGAHYSGVAALEEQGCLHVSFEQLAQTFFPEEFKEIRSYSFPDGKTYDYLNSLIKKHNFIAIHSTSNKPTLIAVESETDEMFIGQVSDNIWAYGLFGQDYCTDWYDTFYFRGKPDSADIEVVIAVSEMEQYLRKKWHKVESYIQKGHLRSLPSDQAVHAQKSIQENRKFSWLEFPGELLEKWELFKIYLDRGVL